MESDARHDHEAGHEQQKQDAGPDIVPLGLVYLEGLLEGHLLVAILELRLRRRLLLIWRLLLVLLVLSLGRVTTVMGRRILLIHGGAESVSIEKEVLLCY